MKYSIITLNSMMLVIFSKCGSHLLIIRTHLRTTMCSDSFFSDDLIKSGVNVYYSLLITGKPFGFVRIV